MFWDIPIICRVADKSDCRHFRADGLYSVSSIRSCGGRRASRGGGNCEILAKTLTVTAGERPMSTPIPQGNANGLVGYQNAPGEESGNVRANEAESSRRFLPHIAMVKSTDTR